MFIVRICLACIGLCLINSAYAQDQNRINGDFYNMRFDQFAKKIDSSLHVHIYYIPTDLDSFRIPPHVQGLSVTELFDTLFRNTPFKVAFDGSGNIYITRYISIKTDLPISY